MGEDFSAQATPRAKRGATMLLRRSNTTKIENVESGVLKIPDAGGPVVLLVSRHAEFRQALAADCAKKGYRCLEAATGAAGLTQFHGAWPDAVVLDLNLADAEAWTLLKELKADSESALAPTLLCFSVPEEAGKAARGFTLGCADFIVKPFDAGKIRTVFQRLPETAGGGGKEVLAIDDSAFARVELQKILEAESYTVRLADSGKAGLRRLTEHAPGLILLDLLMPQMDGVEFLNERNRNPQWRAIPLVLASKDLSAPESQKLNQYLKQVLGNSAYESARMREELCALLKASVKNSNPTKS
jgi:CheY-like chemotaxis protein